MVEKKVVMAYVPVIHRGYLDFFRRHGGRTSEPYCQTDCFVFGAEVIKLIDRQLDYLRKEIRAISPEEACQALEVLDVVYEARVLNLDDCRAIAQAGREIVLPFEDVSRVLVEHYFSANPVSYDQNIFLRWNRDNVNVKNIVRFERVVAVTNLDREFMRLAEAVARHSSDWWRRIGAMATTVDGRMLFSGHNRHLPTPHTPYLDGDPRNTAKRGTGLDLYTSIHAEADVIASAAGSKVSLAGAYLYVTTFPCPPCAKLIARAGLARLYYAEGYAVLDGESILRHYGVEIVKVDFP